jgi:hypothetical protein
VMRQAGIAVPRVTMPRAARAAICVSPANNHK